MKQSVTCAREKTAALCKRIEAFKLQFHTCILTSTVVFSLIPQESCQRGVHEWCDHAVEQPTRRGLTVGVQRFILTQPERLVRRPRFNLGAACDTRTECVSIGFQVPDTSVYVGDAHTWTCLYVCTYALHSNLTDGGLNETNRIRRLFLLLKLVKQARGKVETGRRELSQQVEVLVRAAILTWSALLWNLRRSSGEIRPRARARAS